MAASCSSSRTSASARLVDVLGHAVDRGRLGRLEGGAARPFDPAQRAAVPGQLEHDGGEVARADDDQRDLEAKYEQRVQRPPRARAPGPGGRSPRPRRTATPRRRSEPGPADATITAGALATGVTTFAVLAMFGTPGLEEDDTEPQPRA
jgi:hypothetical protein